MKVNGIDLRKYGAKQLKIEIQPPVIQINKELVAGAYIPQEFETEIQLGHLKISLYFKGENRNKIIRMMSEFMNNFKTSCELEFDGYKGVYKGYMTANGYEKTISGKRFILNMEFDGFFMDLEKEIIFDGTMTGIFVGMGTRTAPCILEIYAKNDLANYKIRGLGEEIIIESLNAGKTLIIDGVDGIVTIDGKNAFNSVDLWEFPKVMAGEMKVSFSSADANVKIKYKPMWI